MCGFDLGLVGSFGGRVWSLVLGGRCVMWMLMMMMMTMMTMVMMSLGLGDIDDDDD